MVSDRRQFLLAAGAAALGGCSASEPTVEAPAPARFDKTLGAQIYTLRFVLPEDPAAAINGLASIGYREVEVLQANFDELRPLVEAAGLAPASMHLMSQLVTRAWGEVAKPQHATVEAAAAWAAEAGVKFVVMPYLPGPERGSDLDHYKRLAETLNAAGESSRAAGLGFAYHNHAFEFQPMGGSTPLDTLLDNTDPQLVQLELDVFWVSVAGEDPVKMLQKHSGRVPLVHLKDKAPECPQQYKEGVAAEYFKEVGNGSLDFASILPACEAAGVQHYFVEQDQTPGDPLDSLRQSYEYLRSLPA